MAPLPENSTPCLFVDYSINGEAHSMLFRGRTGVTFAALADVAQDVLDEIDVLLGDGWTLLGTRTRAAGANFTLPGPTLMAPTPGGGALNSVNNPRFLSFVGRGAASGRRVRLYIYGMTFAMESDYRFGPGQNGVVDAVQNILQSAAIAGTLGSVADDGVNWQEYANVGFNSYWQREQRA